MAADCQKSSLSAATVSYTHLQVDDRKPRFFGKESVIPHGNPLFLRDIHIPHGAAALQPGEAFLQAFQLLGVFLSNLLAIFNSVDPFFHQFQIGEKHFCLYRFQIPGRVYALLFVDYQMCIRDRIIADPYIHAYRFLVLVGIRPGELYGLKRSDRSGNRLRILRSINEVGEITEGKNENAIRGFVLTPSAAEELSLIHI